MGNSIVSVIVIISVFGIWCFSAKHAAFRSDNKDWLARDKKKIQFNVLVYYKVDIIISSKCNMFSPWYGWKIAHLALNNNHSLTHYKERDAYCAINYAYYTKPSMVILSGIPCFWWLYNYQYTWKYIIFTLSFIHVYPFVGPSWSYGSWIYIYLCNQCLSPLTLIVRTLFMKRCTRYNIMW